MAPKIGHRELLSIHQSRLEYLQANHNELTTNALRNPLREHLDLFGFDIKNARRIQTSDSLQVGTSVTVGNSITINQNIALGGNITDLDGNVLAIGGLADTNISNLQNNQILKYNSTSSKWENADNVTETELFENYNATDEVGLTLGQVSSGTKVSTLRTEYDTIDDVIGKILNIQSAAEPIPSVSNHSITIGATNNEVKILYGTINYTYDLSLNYNRGTWSNAYSVDGITTTNLLPYTPASTANYDGAWEYSNTNVPVDTSPTITDTSPPSVTYTATTINLTFTSWQNYTLNVSMTSTRTGTVYTVSPHINSYILPTPVFTLNASKTWKVYKPVFVDGVITTSIKGTPGGPGYSNRTQTTQVFYPETTDIIVVNHNVIHTIAVPFDDPLLVGVYDNLFSDQFNPVSSFTSVPISYPAYSYLPSLETAGVSTYHLVTLFNTGRTDLLDVKLTTTNNLNP